MSDASCNPAAAEAAVSEAPHLSDGEEWLRLCLEAARMITWEWDVASGAIRYSELARALPEAGLFTHFSTLQSLLQVLHPEDRARMEQAVQRSVMEDSPYDLEFRLPGLDGREFWIHSRGRMLRDPRGQPWRMLGVSTDITARQEADAALRRREGHFSALLEHAMDVVVMIDVRGTVLYASPALERVLGYAPAEWVGRRGFDWIHPEEVSEVREFLSKQSSIPGPSPLREQRFRHQDGSWRHIELIGNNRLADPAVRGFVINGRDITERKQAEAALAAKEQIYRTLFNLAPCGILLEDTDGTILDVNDALCRASGFARAELVGRNVRLFVPPENTDSVDEDFAALRCGQALAHEVVNVRKDGTRRVMALREMPLALPDGRQGVLVAAEDITERKRADEALRQSEERYRSLVNNVNVGVYRNTPGDNGRLVEANPAVARIHGYDSVEEFLAISASDHYQNPADREVYLAELLRAGVVRNYELRLKRKDGTPIVASVTATAHRGPDGTVDWIDGVLEDITERKQAEEALRASRDTLEQRVQERTAELQAVNAALRESERRNTALFNATHQPMLLMDLKGIILAANAAMSQRFSLRPEELVGADLHQFMPPELDKVRHAYADEVIRTGQAVQFEDERAGMQMDNYIYPVLDEQGKVTALTVFSMDITARKQAEEKLRASEALLRAAFDNAPFEFWVRDQNEVCVMANASTLKHWRHLLGKRPEDARVSPEALAIWQDNNRRAFAGEVVLGEQELHEAGGSRWIYNVIAPFRVDGEIRGIVGFNLDITERKRAETEIRQFNENLEQRVRERTAQWEAANEALRASEEKYRFLVERTPVVAWITEQQGRTSYISPNVAQIYGYTAEEIRAAGDALWLERIHAEDRARVEAAYQNIFAGQPYDVEYQIQRKDDRWVWFHDHAISCIEKDGVKLAYGVFSDITERKAAEAVLRDREALQRTILQTTQDGFCVVTRYGKILDINPAYCAMSGYTRDELLAMSLPEVEVNWPDPDSFARRVGQIIQARNELFETRHRTKEGGIIDLEISANVIDPDGHRLCAFIRDITARKQMEATLRSREEHLRLGMESAGMVTWDLDVATGAIRYSENMPAFVGGADIAPYCSVQKILEVIHPEDQEGLAQALKRATTEGSPFEQEYRARMVNGTYRWILGRGRCFSDASGQPQRILGVSMDISARKQAEQLLLRSEEKFSKAFYSSPAPISISTFADGRFIEVNDSFLRLTGRRREELVGHTSVEVGMMTVGEREKAVQPFQATGSARQVNVGLRRPSGEIRTVFVAVETVEMGGARFILAQFEDITERQQAEAALRARESMLRAFYDSPGALRGIVELVKGDLLVIAANSALALSYGRSPEELQNCPASKLGVAGEALTSWLPHFKKSQRSGQPVTFEHWDGGQAKVRCTLVTVCCLGLAPGGNPRFGLVAMDITERKQAEAVLAQLPRRIFEAQETERQRVARELHDGVNQLLSSTKFRLHTAEEALPRLNKEARASLERCRELIGQALEESRRISHDLRPQALDDLGLVTACRSLCEEFQSRTGLPVQCTIAPLAARLPATTELHVFRIVQEALNNIAKHAAATRVRVSMSRQKGGLELKVEDNGCGFDSKAPRAPGSKGHGLGLTNIRERAAVLEGTCEIKSVPGRGTKIRLLLPLEK